MKSSILNHLHADDRARMVDTLKITLDKLSASASSCAGWGDRGRGHIYFEHLRWFPPEMQDSASGLSMAALVRIDAANGWDRYSIKKGKKAHPTYPMRSSALTIPNGGTRIARTA